MQPQDAHVVVIEDDVHLQRLFRWLLCTKLRIRLHHEYRAGRDFFAWIEQQPVHLPDLILLDLHLPQQDGFMIFEQIRTYPLLAHTPVIATTANVTPGYQIRTREAGFDGFLGKPINAHRFPVLITRILAGQSVWEPF